jgi:lysophospholipase L1-like esterase
MYVCNLMHSFVTYACFQMMQAPIQESSEAKGGILSEPWPLKQHTGRRRVALIGHSYIRRLRDYMAHKGCHNLKFPVEDTRVDTFCKGGAALRVVPDDRWVNSFLQPALVFNPSVIYIHVGENDLGHLTEQSLVDHLMQFVNSIITLNHPEIVIISQLFPMPFHSTKHNITSINEVLSSAVDALNHKPSVIVGHCVTRVVYWRHKFGIWGDGCADLFDSDGIHLSQQGMRQYYFSVHNAVGKALKSL